MSSSPARFRPCRDSALPAAESAVRLLRECRERTLDAGPTFTVAFAVRCRYRLGSVECQDVSPQARWNGRKRSMLELREELGVCVIGERVFTVAGRASGVEVGVREFESVVGDVRYGGSISIGGLAKASRKQQLDLRCRRLEGQRLERSDLRQQ